MANRLYLIPDHHDENPRFHFDEYAQALAEGFLNPKNRTPWVTAVYGPWGSGKTTLLQRVKAILEEAQRAILKDARPVRTVWFNAWKYGSEETVLAGLLRALLAAMKEEGWKAEGAAEFVKKKVEAGGLGSLTLKAFKELAAMPSFAPGLRRALTKAEGTKQVSMESKQAYYDQFEELFGQLVDAWLSPTRAMRDREGAWRKGRGEDGIVIVFVDDLDRCQADRVVAVFEAAKLFLDLPNVAVVLAADRGPLLERLAETYKDRAGRYLEKVVTVAFDLPPIHGGESKEYASAVLQAHPFGKEIKKHLDLVIDSVGEGELTPRALKTFLNDLSIKVAVLSKMGRLGGSGNPEVGQVIAYHLLLRSAPELVRPILRRGETLLRVRNCIGALVNAKEEDVGKALQGMPVSPEMRDFLMDKQALRLWRTLPEESGAICTLAQNAPPSLYAEVDIIRSSRVSAGRFPESVMVSAGLFHRGTGGEADGDAPLQGIEVGAFEIDRTPVTNAQYREFLRAVDWKEGRPSLPDDWRDSRFPVGKEDHPVVCVSWEDAMGYCRWRSEFTGQGWTLPSEAQWEKAARGIDERTYPWGSEEPTAVHANFGVTIGDTTPVGSYPAGQTPYGLFDMAGNIWEWCLDWYEPGYYVMSPSTDPLGPAEGKFRVMRGGSWTDEPAALRCATRNYYDPTAKNADCGFRAVRALK